MKSHVSFKFLIVFIVMSITRVSGYNPPTEESGLKTLSPYFAVISQKDETDCLPLKSTSAEVVITGVIANVTIRQRYVNSGKNPLEAVYVFPMSTRAAVYAMKMTVGSREITAKIKEKDTARKEYNKAKREGRRASLLEQNRPNVFTMNVANIVAGDIIEVELKYTELLLPENGVYSFVYPTVVGPRYSHQSAKTANRNDRFVNTPYTRKGNLPFYKFHFKASINASVPIQNINCSSHKIRTQFNGVGSANITLPADEIYGGNRDLILNYSLRGNSINSGIQLFEQNGEKFFLLMVQPPKQIIQDKIPPREYIFLMDVSGSMDGFPISVSKKLLRNLIVNLRENDKFNVILFAGSAATMSTESVNATSENIEKALHFIEGPRGGGGTELLTALKKAYALPPLSGQIARSYILVSDGYVDVEAQSFKIVHEQNGAGNFFCFGIGSSVNRYLMEGLAFMGNGEATIVEDAGKSADAAEKFRRYISSPLLSNIKIDYGNLQVYDVEPAVIHDLMADRPLVIFGKYKGNATGDIKISGMTGQGVFEQSIGINEMKTSATNAAIRYLWARERIKTLGYFDNTGTTSHMQPNVTTQKAEITALGLEYGLMTAYTSFVAIDKPVAVDKNQKLITVKQPLPLPKGVSNKAVGNQGNQSASGTVCETNEEDSKSDLYENDIASTSINVEQEVQEESALDVVEQMPGFPGGDAALMNFIGQNLQYPVVAQENGIQGKVILRIEIKPNGSIGKITILRSLDPACDKEAIRMIRQMPKWIPGRQNGKKVSVYYVIPISFKLN